MPINADTFRAHCRERAPELIPRDEGCSGPVAEIVELAVQRMGHTIKWSNVPWARTITVAEFGDVDIIPRHSMNAKRDVFLNSVAYGYSIRKVYYMITPQKNIKINKFEDLIPYKIGALRGSFYSDLFANSLGLNKYFFNNTEQIVSMLESGRIDIAVTSSNHDVEKFRMIKGVREAEYIEYFYNGRYISIPKKSPMSKYYNNFKSIINDMVSSGEIGVIFNKYSLKAPEQK